MKFKLDAVRHAAVSLCVAGLLAACGGATQVESFSPRRVIVFGDEASTIVDSTNSGNGRKYSVNGIDYDTTVTPSVPKVPTQFNCAANTIWVQDLANSYGMTFPECKGTSTSQVAVMRAAANATVASLTTQIDQFVAGDAFSSNDLVTVMVGTNDVINEYLNYSANPSLGTDASIAAMEAAGTALGAQIVRLTDLGAKVLVSTIPELGNSPFAAAEEAANTGRAALLSQMSRSFNTKLRLKLEDVRNGGRAVGLVLADDLVLAMVKNPAAYGLNNTASAACTSAALTDCNDLTMATVNSVAATAGTWLWAGDRWLSTNAQNRIGSLAITRARNNPF